MQDNLVQHRAGPNVWEQASRPQELDAGRLMMALAGGVLLAAGIRRRSLAGLAAMVAGAALAMGAAAGRETRRRWLMTLQQRCAWGVSPDEDLVNEAVEESFPASDAPALTPAAPQSRVGSKLTSWRRN